MPFVDLDEVARDLYAEVGQGVEALDDRAMKIGFVEAHRWWQPARVHAVRRVLESPTASVVAFGAGHSHYEDDRWSAEIVPLLADAFVVLLLPEADDAVSVSLLRRRCIDERGADHGWVHGGVVTPR